MSKEPKRRTPSPSEEEFPTGGKSSNGAARPFNAEPLDRDESPSSADAFEEEVAELRRSLPIHLHRLHEQCAEQPELYRKAGELFAEAKVYAARAKLEADERKATTSLDARKRPEAYALDKVTETSISAAVAADPLVQKAERRALDMQEFADDARAIMAAYEQRKSMLDTEARLYLGNYWGGEGAAFGATNATEEAIMRKRRGES